MNKTTLLFIILLFSTSSIVAQKEINIISGFTDVCPYHQTDFSIVENLTSAVWRVTNGSFSETNPYDTIRSTPNKSIVVYWKDVKCTTNSLPKGTLNIEGQMTVNGVTQSVKGEKEVKIKSVNNMSLGVLKANTPRISMGRDTIYVSLPSEEINYYGTTEKIKNFEWTLPEGWEISTGSTGVFISGSTRFNIITDEFSNGEIKVRALNNCNGDNLEKSLYSTVEITREYKPTAFPLTVPFGQNYSATYTVPLVLGSTYEWQAPVGWEIEGGSNVFTGVNRNSVQIISSFCPSSEKIKVQLTKGSEISSWIEFPTTVALPAITPPPTGEIKQYQPAIFSLDMPDDNIASVEWLVNGTSAGVATNTSSLSFRINESGMVKIAAKLTLEGCSPVSIPEIEVDVAKAPDPVISGPTTVCDEATYTIDHFDDLPAGASVEWKNNVEIERISHQGRSSATFRKIKNGQSTVRAVITIGSNSIPLSQSVSVGVPYRPWVHKGSTIYKGSSADYTMCIGQGTTSLYLMFINPDNSADVRSWEVTKTINPNNFSLVQDGTYLYVNPLKKDGGAFTVTSRNECGVSEAMTIYLTIETCEDGPIPIDPPSLPIFDFIISPNPATDMVSVELREEQPSTDGVSTQRATTKVSSGSYEIELWNMGSMLKRFTTNQPVYQISVSELPAGIYFMRVIKDGKTYTKKLIKR